jgi:hypothetical protein
MSTDINITVGDEALLARAKQQQSASRQAQLGRESSTRLETQATAARTASLAAAGKDAAGNSLIGTIYRTPQVERRPAASRKDVRVPFGYLPAGTSQYGFYDAYTKRAFISPTTPITARKYSVIKLGNPNTCPVSRNPDTYLFRSRSQELLQFVQDGGVLWIQNEWLSNIEADFFNCGIRASVINPYIQNLFGCSIRFALQAYQGYNLISDLPKVGEADGNFLVYEAPGFTAPALFYTKVVSPIVNGTAIYSHPDVGAVLSFEKIGEGFIVLSADSNATVEYPIGIYEGQEYTIIDALRTLR